MNYAHELTWQLNYDQIPKINNVQVFNNQNTEGQDFILNVAGSISGMITDSSGLPVSTAIVSLLDHTGMIFHPTFAITDNNGYYLLKNVSEGIYTLMVNADGYPSKGLENVGVYAGQETSGIVCVLNTDGGTLSGTVYDANTQMPLPNATVSV